MAKDIKLIISLGNPDKKYKNTYHNVGHLFANLLQKRGIQNSKFKIIESNSYMNQSGLFVKEELKKHKIKPENLLVVHDDSDIELGKTKIDFGRGSAGHKGVQNIIDQIKTKNFWRLRIGIRPPDEHTRKKAERFVLKKIPPTNKKVLETIFQKIAKKLA